MCLSTLLSCKHTAHHEHANFSMTWFGMNLTFFAQDNWGTLYHSAIISAFSYKPLKYNSLLLTTIPKKCTCQHSQIYFGLVWQEISSLSWKSQICLSNQTTVEVYSCYNIFLHLLLDSGNTITIFPFWQIFSCLPPSRMSDYNCLP